MSRMFTVALLSAMAAVPAAQGSVRTQSGPSTTAPNVFVNIQATISDTRITLKPRKANRGDEARFIIRNVGTKPHSFTLGSSARGTGEQTGFSRTLKPRTQTTLLLFLDFRGPVPYRSVLPHDRGLPGMKGIFTIA
jgi:hypothetical protein